MIATFVKLRIKQGIRFLIELGIIRSLILLFLSFIVLTASLTVASIYSWVSSVLLLIVIYSLHTLRRDKTFLKTLNIIPYQVYLIEYHLISIPFYINFLLHTHWIEAFIAFIGVSLVPLSSFYLNSESSVSQQLNFIPTEAFEWKSGVRKNSVRILLLYILAIALFQFPLVSFLIIIIFTFLVTSFYNESESRQMVEVFDLSPRKFILMKWKKQLTLFWVGCLPLVLLCLFANKEYWYVLLAIILISSIIQLLSIHLKYTLYEPGTFIDKGIFMVIYFFSLFVPFFVPVPLIMLFIYYHKSISNLKNYLHD